MTETARKPIPQPDTRRGRFQSGTRIIEQPGQIVPWPEVDQDLIPTQPESERPTLPPEHDVRDTLPAPPPEEE